MQQENDYVGAEQFPLKVVRVYHSKNTNEAWNGGLAPGTSRFGSNWTGNYDQRIQLFSNAGYTTAYVSRPDGRTFYFNQVGGTWVADEDIVERLSSEVDSSGQISGWLYVTTDDTFERYDVAGRLISLTARNGLEQLLTYSDGDTPPDVAPRAGLLITVTGSSGRAIGFTYDGRDRVKTMTDPAGATYQYGYDSNNNLVTLTYPDASVRTYRYNEPAYTGNQNVPHALTGIVDENGVRYASYTYSYNPYSFTLSATGTEHAQGAEKITIAYNGSSAVATDALGAVSTYTFQTILGVAKNTAITRTCPGCTTSTTTKQYDGNGNLIRQVNSNGSTTTYEYELSRNLETARAEAVGTPQQRRTETDWHPLFRLPTEIRVRDAANVLLNRTQFGYDSIGSVSSRTETDVTTNQTRTWNYTYTDGTEGTLPGLLKRVDGPRTDVSDITTYGYDSQGSLSTVTNALGHISRVSSYNPHGRPLTVVDPNGLTTTLSYDLRGRLTSRSVGAETTSFSYDAAGNLSRITSSDGERLEYRYDAAHRLIGIDDGRGNAIDYTLDAAGNRIQEKTYDPNGQLAATRQRVYNKLGQLTKSVGAQGQSTTYAYDAGGRNTQTTDPAGALTGKTFDALDRLITVTDPLNSVTRYGYDGGDRVTSVTDPRAVATTYTYDGLGRLLQEQSPDRGILSYTYDAAGNRLTQTDAKNQTTSYAYDALNRLMQTTHADGEVVTYTYDSGANAIGQLTSVSETDSTIAWTYDGRGRVTARIDTIGTRSYTTNYAYDSTGRLAILTYPSGLNVTFHYDGGRASGIDVNGAPLLSGVSYRPFGPISGWLWADGTPASRTFNLDGRVTSQTLGSLTRTLDYDSRGNIVAINDPLTNATFGYDGLSRLTAANDPSYALGWTFDANGNRLTETSGSNLKQYAYTSGTNRLAQITAGGTTAAYQYDATGNTLLDRTHSYTYDARNRLVGVDGMASYRHNALGQRVEKLLTVSGARTQFVYDEGGQLIGEYDESGNALQETVWLGSLPVATVRNGVVYRVHADHLGTPRVVTDATGQAVWRWNSDPYGTTAANEDPDGDGAAFSYNLRFPGQYFDSESGLHYNYFRDYDPGTGRYIEADPIGLAGGLNSYLYANANPTKYIDQKGLSAGVIGRGLVASCQKFPAACAVVLCRLLGGCEVPEPPGMPMSPPDEPANDPVYDSCPIVGDNNPPVPNNCAEWKARVLKQKEAALMLFLITENPSVIANVNYAIMAYNNSCEYITGRVNILLVDLNGY